MRAKSIIVVVRSSKSPDQVQVDDAYVSVEKDFLCCCWFPLMVLDIALDT